MKKAFLVLLIALFFATPSFAAKVFDASVYDAALDEIATATRLTFTSAEPANFAGIAAVLLASVVIDGTDFTKSDVANGRRSTVGAQTGMTPAADGTVTHACLDDGVTLLGCTTTTSQAVTTAQTWDSPAFTIDIVLQ